MVARMNTDAHLSVEHFDPWNGNIVDLTMTDGSHRTGLLQRVDSEWVRLKAPRDAAKLPDDGLVRIADSVSIARGARN